MLKVNGVRTLEQGQWREKEVGETSWGWAQKYYVVCVKEFDHDPEYCYGTSESFSGRRCYN